MIHIISYFNFLGTIGLVDYDVVDLSNLQRQILHTEEKVGVAKVDSRQMILTEIGADGMYSTRFK